MASRYPAQTQQSETQPQTQSQTQEQPARYGEIFDRGYMHYDGPRLGRRQAFRSLVLYSMNRAMGIRKPWTAKVLPFLLYVSATIPLIVMIGVNAVFPEADFASYTGYMQAIFVIVGIFVATTAPEMVCVDRQERTLPLYFSRAISRIDYVFAKIVAMTILTMTLSALPAIILWAGRQLLADSPGRAFRENLPDLWRLILIGGLIALMLGTGGLFVSSLTNRKGVAVTVITIGFLVVSAVALSLMTALDDQDWTRYAILASLGTMFNAVSLHLFHDETPGDFVLRADFSLRFYIIYILGMVVLGTVLMVWRYSPRDQS